MKNIALLIEKFCENEEEYDFYRDYSGRFMFEKLCVGFTCNNPNTALIDLVDYLCDNDIDNSSALINRVCSDDLGLDKIIYFPDIQYPELEK